MTNAPLSPPRGVTRGLYVITDEAMGGGHLVIARAAVAGGAAVVQLRDKSTPRPQLLREAHAVREITRLAGVCLIINDDVALATEVGADGVHLGPGDMPVRAARTALGDGAWLGASCANAVEAASATADGASYIGAGAVFATSTKADAGAPIGLDGLRGIVEAASLPVAAIGGIHLGNIAAVVEAGAGLVCVVSAVAGAGDAAAMESATRELVRRMQNN